MRRFSKVAARRGFRPVEPASEINPVQVQLHDFLFAETILDAARQKNLEELAAERFFFQSKTVSRELLGDRACALSHMAGQKVFKSRSHDSEKIVAVMLIKFTVLNPDHGVDQIARQLIVWNRFAVLDVNLAEDFIVPIENYAGRFHLFELAQIESRRAVSQIRSQNKKINRHPTKEHGEYAGRHVNDRTRIPRRTKPITGRRHEMGMGIVDQARGEEFV